VLGAAEDDGTLEACGATVVVALDVGAEGELEVDGSGPLSKPDVAPVLALPPASGGSTTPVSDRLLLGLVVAATMGPPSPKRSKSRKEHPLPSTSKDVIPNP
jgi:hypothetical protein